MKKTLYTLIASLAVVGSAFAQGTIASSTTASTYSTYINSTTYNTSLNGVYNTTGTKTATAANGYIYALLFQPFGSGTQNPLTGYSVALQATNSGTTAGGVRGPGSTTGVPVTGWGAPTDGTVTTAERNDFLLVGWSSNLGVDWATVSAQLQSGSWAANGYFGVSALGNAYAGGGPLSVPAVSIFGVTAGAPGGLTQGLTLYAVAPAPVPEPSTLALAGLGGLALLAFRRKK